MPTEHVDAPDGERHEPKGGDSATVDTVYVSDGANSGTWKKVDADTVLVTDTAGFFSATDVEAALNEIKDKEAGGWGYYKDDGAASPVMTTTVGRLSINGLDATSDSGHLPLGIRGSGELWSTVSDDITPIAEGDAYSIRVDIPVTGKTGSPTELLLQFDIGSTSSPSNVIVERRIGVTSTPPYSFSVGFPLFISSAFLANGCQIFCNVDTGTLTTNAPAILLTRTTNGDN